MHHQPYPQQFRSITHQTTPIFQLLDSHILPSRPATPSFPLITKLSNRTPPPTLYNPNSKMLTLLYSHDVRRVVLSRVLTSGVIISRASTLSDGDYVFIL